MLSRSPELLSRLAARGRDAKMAICVEVEYAFFHCAKAYIRSKLWRHKSWPKKRNKYKVRFGPYFGKNKAQQDAIDKSVDKNYADVEKSVDGLQDEPDA